MIRIKTETFYIMSTDWLDELIEEHTGKKYKTAGVCGWLPGSEHSLDDVNGYIGSDTDSLSVRNFINDLIAKDVLPSGNYLLQVPFRVVEGYNRKLEQITPRS